MAGREAPRGSLTGCFAPRRIGSLKRCRRRRSPPTPVVLSRLIFISYPQELADAIEWARAHEEQCEEMGKEAQRFASRFFTVDSLRCYWLLLLESYARLQRFTPGKRRNPPTSLVEAKAYVARALRIQEEKGLAGTFDAAVTSPPDWVY